MSGNSSADETAIAALNASDTEAVMPPYAEGGVFMLPDAQSVVGKGRYAKPMMRPSRRLRSGSSSPSRKSCDGAAMGVRAENSAGTQKIDATGVVSAEGNRVLFNFGKGDDGKWRIPPTASPPPIQPGEQRLWMPQ
jgi:ketosteroid isomerase-like protein